jgi:hypothetical protein
MSTTPGADEDPVAVVLRRAIELAVYAPIGLAVELGARVPKLVETGRQRVALARFVGRIAVGQISKALEPHPASTPPPPSADEAVTGAQPPEQPAAETGSVAQREPVPTPARHALVIPDYDSLAASQIVARLGSLTPDERDDVERYERAHRGRRTVLGKLAQLRGR